MMAEKYYVGLVNGDGYVTGILGIFKTFGELKKAYKPLYQKFWENPPIGKHRRRGLSFKGGGVFVAYEVECLVGRRLSKEEHYEWRLYEETIGEYAQVTVGQNYYIDKWCL